MELRDCERAMERHRLGLPAEDDEDDEERSKAVMSREDTGRVARDRDRLRKEKERQDVSRTTLFWLLPQAASKLAPWVARLRRLWLWKEHSQPGVHAGPV